MESDFRSKKSEWSLKSLKLMLTVFNVFFIYVATEWKYRTVVHDFVFGVLSGATQLSGAKVPAATQTPSVYFQS